MPDAAETPSAGAHGHAEGTSRLVVIRTVVILVAATAALIYAFIPPLETPVLMFSGTLYGLDPMLRSVAK